MMWRRAAADPARGELPIERRELPFLIVSSIVIAAVAQLTDPAPMWKSGLLAIAVGGFVARGLLPAMASELFAAVVVVPVTVAVGPAGTLEIALFLLVMMVLYTAWHLGSTVRAAAILTVGAASPLLLAIGFDADINPVPWVGACGFTFLLGRTLRRQRQLIEELEATRLALADAAVATERQRIARELHDLAGHTLAAVLLHVTGARHVLRRDLDEAERALLDAERVGRASFDQIRATVAALRTTETGTDPALADGDDLHALVHEYRTAGLAIEARICSDPSSLGGPVGVALHRIVREALANIARHAPANRVDLMVANDDRRSVSVLVADHGTPADPTPGDGFGVIGMRERARAIGGTLTAGPTSDGWRVEATLPLEPAPDEP